MQLFGSYTSPFVRKIRVILHEKGLNYQFIPEDVWSANTKIEAHNPLGKVPCMTLDNNMTLYDSKVISDILERLYPTPKLIPTEEIIAYIEIKKLEALSDGIMEAAVSMLLENRFHTEEKRSAEWLIRQEKKIKNGCDLLSSLLEKSQSDFLMAEFSLADITAGCALLYVELRFPKIEWRNNYPQLNQYVIQLCKRESFIATHPA